ncbi:MAG: L,D-transpeptidase family protein [Desulfovibrio sp.]|jgi:hypothetical protein|nr:L,D-transpeptidase family protein [Desulfovibrio sp.]
MQRYSGSRPRYPKKRNTPGIILLLGLPALLLPIIFAGALFFSDSGDRTQAASKKNVGDAGALPELSASEAYPQGPLPASLHFDKLLLEKGRRRLTAFAQGKAVRVYLVALGENPAGQKEQEGDKRTPEGRYRINDKNPNSAFHKNLGISYPDEKDRARAAASGKNPGGNIKIHGLAPDFAYLGDAHRLTDWTYGCIAVTNPEIDELFARTEIGTPIEIVP